jgi:cold shock CspA family protein
MQVPIEITYRGVDKTEYIDNLIKRKAAKLEEICDYLISCHIAVRNPHRRRQLGNPYEVRLDLRVPPKHELLVKRKSTGKNNEEPLEVVIRRTFQAVQRELKKLVEKQRGEVKKHPHQETMGMISQLFLRERYGFLKTLGGREVYFHSHSVLNNCFDHLEIGTGVRFVEEMGEKGPQASTVEIIDKPSFTSGKG